MTMPGIGQLGNPDRATAALATVEACAGAVHRLAWDGPDETGDRRRALGWFRAAVATLGRSDRALAAVLDWWLVSALGEDPVELAWSVERELPSRLGDVLRAILECDGPRRLDVVRRPARSPRTSTTSAKRTRSAGRSSARQRSAESPPMGSGCPCARMRTCKPGPAKARGAAA